MKTVLIAVTFLLSTFAVNAQDYSLDPNASEGIDIELCDHFFPGELGDLRDRNLVTLCRLNYASIYDTECKIPLLVFENHNGGAMSEAVEREDRFAPDPSLAPEHSATLEDYRGSGYDRGHMMPADNNRADSAQMEQSFYFSNIIPQNSTRNRGDWRQIERVAQQIVEELPGDNIYIITGVVINGEPETIGDGVCVPEAMFKTIITPYESLTYFSDNDPPHRNGEPEDYLIHDFTNNEDIVMTIAGFEWEPFFQHNQ